MVYNNIRDLKCRREGFKEAIEYLLVKDRIKILEAENNKRRELKKAYIEKVYEMFNL
jgi:hypothetical protein